MRLQLGARQHGSRRVVRVVREDRARARRDARRDVVRGQVEAALRPQRHVHHRGARRCDDPLVGRVGGLGNEHLVAALGDGEEHREERGLGAREEGDALGRDRPARARRGHRREGVEQRRLAARVGVARAPAAQARDGGLDDGRRRREVRLADRRDDHVLAARDACRRRGGARPRRRGRFLRARRSGERGEAHRRHYRRAAPGAAPGPGHEHLNVHSYVITYRRRLSSAATRPRPPRGPAASRCASWRSRSSVSAPMLSQVERGTTSPTLAVAEKIADGLGLTLSQLLRLDEAPPFEIVRAGRPHAPRPRTATAGRCSRSTTPGQRMAVSRHRLEPGSTTGGAPMHRAGSREFALVEQGPVALELDGAEHALDTGDSVIFDADLAHRFRAGAKPAVIVSVVTAGLRRS